MSRLPEPSEPSAPTMGNSPDELPFVEPPTSGFIIQLFVIPAVIVAVVIVVWLLFGRLAGGERNAMDYVETIRSENENRRWRAAHELASLIGNDARLARDPELLGKLTELLSEELGKEGNPRLKVYLVVALGAFQTLDTRSTAGRLADPLAALAGALSAKQPLEVRMAAAESLAKHAARSRGTLDHPEAARALAEASDDAEPELRKRATYALGFFGSDSIVEALHRRLGDDDREVRYNAAIALGRRGDPAALQVFRVMLSPDELRQVNPAKRTAEGENQIEQIQLSALQALQESVHDGRPTLAQLLQREVTSLTHSNLASVRIEAEALLKILPPLRSIPES